jgi:orotidine-5'-phosphate decarboxylase
LPTSFAARLESGFEKYGQLCVGVDAHEALLRDWGLDDSVDGLRTFAFTVLEASVGRVAAIKPQVSFFERFGARGFSVLEDFAEVAAQSDIQVIMDAKRGDIGSTMQGYFDAWLGENAPFVCDALTVSPYLGVDSLSEFMSQAIERSKGLFVLAATSNPEAKELQRAKVADHTLAAEILSRINAINEISSHAKERMGSIGAVVGATLNFNTVGISNLFDDNFSRTPILAPGFGAQGANLSDLSDVFGQSAHRVLASVSRSVLEVGPNSISKAIDSAKAQLAEGLNHE